MIILLFTKLFANSMEPDSSLSLMLKQFDYILPINIIITCYSSVWLWITATD